MIRVRSLAARLVRAPTRIAVRLLLFNVLLVFLPVAGLAYLDVYEQHLLDQQERAMSQLGRLLAASLAASRGAGPLDGPEAQALLDRVSQTTDARLRVIDLEGRLLADSQRTQPGDAPSAPGPYLSQGRLGRALRGSPVYRVGAWLGLTWRSFTDRRHAVPMAEMITDADGRVRLPEITRALQAGYGAATRLSAGGQRSLTLYAALPIRAAGGASGVVLVSQSTWRILQRLYDVRLRMFEVVIVALAFAVVLTGLASFTIVRPLRQLRDDAEALVDGRGRLTRRFRGTRRADEIGELARALEALTGRLDAHLRFTERFAADVTHEFRNPLASIRASAETLADVQTREQHAQFLKRIEEDIRRLETLLAGVRDITHVDARLEEEPWSTVLLDVLMCDSASARGVPVDVTVHGGPLSVEGTPDRLAQVIDNLLDNAEGFTPAGARIEMTGERRGPEVRVSVRDHGAGIPDAHLERVFERFFSHRPDQAGSRTHAGLGLAIARRIAEGHGGTLTAVNHAHGGAVFTLTLPARPPG